MGISECKINTTTMKIQNLRYEPFLYRIKSSNYICDRLTQGKVRKQMPSKERGISWSPSTHGWPQNQKQMNQHRTPATHSRTKELPKRKEWALKVSQRKKMLLKSHNIMFWDSDPPPKKSCLYIAAVFS